MSLHIDRLSFSYPDHLVFEDFTLHLKAGVHAIVGANGAGKSTLLKLLAGLLPLKAGQMLLKPDIALEQLPSWQRAPYVGVSFQDPSHQFFLKTVEQELWQQCVLCDKELEEFRIRERTKRYAQLFELDSLLQQEPSSLRFGQAQRVAWAIAMLGSQRRLHLLDEPTARLDDQKSRILECLVDEVRKQNMKGAGKVLLFITHDMDFIEYLCDSVVWIDAGKVGFQGSCSSFFWSGQTPYMSTGVRCLRERGIKKEGALRDCYKIGP